MFNEYYDQKKERWLTFNAKKTKFLLIIRIDHQLLIGRESIGN